MGPDFRKSESLKPEEGAADENPSVEANEATSDSRAESFGGGLDFLTATIIGRIELYGLRGRRGF